MQDALRDREGVAISRPIKTAELRIKDLEDSVTAAEIAEAAANEGECQIAEVRVGPIRQDQPSRHGLDQVPPNSSQ